MEFKEILKEILSDSDKTQTELARKINVKPSQISEWLKGKANPGYETLRNIIIGLNISPNYILGLEDDLGVKVETDGAMLYSAEEKKLIEDYRKLNSDKRELIKSNIKAMLPNGKAEK